MRHAQAGIPCGPHCKCNNCHNGKQPAPSRQPKGTANRTKAGSAAAAAVVPSPQGRAAQGAAVAQAEGRGEHIDGAAHVIASRKTSPGTPVAK